MISLRSKSTGHEWLWTNPYLREAPVRQNDSYIRQHDLGGWDEICPTIDPCRIKGTAWTDRELTDHGEIWARPCRVSADDQPDEGALTQIRLSVASKDPEFEFDRCIELDADRADLNVTYTLRNGSDKVMPYIWAAHPLLAISPGMRLRLPGGATVVCKSVVGESAPVTGRAFAWPRMPLSEGGELDLSAIPHRDTAAAYKLFADFGNTPERAWAELINTDGKELLRMEFDASQIPCLGLWLNYGGWSGCGSAPYFNMGMEPTTTPNDSLLEAIRMQTAPQLQAGESVSWDLGVSIRKYEVRTNS